MVLHKRTKIRFLDPRRNIGININLTDRIIVVRCVWSESEYSTLIVGYPIRPLLGFLNLTDSLYIVAVDSFGNCGDNTNDQQRTEENKKTKRISDGKQDLKKEWGARGRKVQPEYQHLENSNRSGETTGNCNR